jgi:serine/threonine protein kinase
MDFHPFAPADIKTALDRRYVVGPEIAVGGQGAVFKATRILRPDRTDTYDIVALKLHFHQNQDIRVQREISAMQDIIHATLARLVEHGHCDVAGRHTRFVAYDFIDGETLANRLKCGPLLESEVLRIGRDISAAIAAIWARRIVHGDIKPSNIMLRDSGGAVLIDLGAARHLEADYADADVRKPFGTAGYFSPEQARGARGLTCASDVFSLGIVLMQCLLGRHPTDYHQTPLAEGFRASGGKLAVSVGLMGRLDKMLSANPSFRPNPAELSRYFQMLDHQLETDFAMGPREPETPKYISRSRKIRRY